MVNIFFVEFNFSSFLNSDEEIIGAEIIKKLKSTMFPIMYRNLSFVGSVLNKDGCFKNEMYGDFRKLSKAQLKFSTF